MIKNQNFVKGNTIITILDRPTGRVRNTTIAELYDELLHTSGILENRRYEIINESGFRWFTGISRVTLDNWLEITFSNDSILECSHKNLIKKDGKFIMSKKLKENDNITKFLSVQKIKSSKGKTSEFFGVIGMKYCNQYLGNHIVNCSI